MKKKALMCTILVALCILTAAGCTADKNENPTPDLEVTTPAPTPPAPPTPLPTEHVDEALDQAISDAIVSHNKEVFRGGDLQMFATEYHEVLKTVPQDDVTEVYLMALYVQYTYKDGKVEQTGGSSGPCAVTFAVTDGAYSVTDYWEPEDGEYFNSSIQERFPEDIVVTGTVMSNPDAMGICDQRAAEYFEGVSK